MKNPMEANNWYEDLYHVHDGGNLRHDERDAVYLGAIGTQHPAE